jgi:hypothetical protein
MYLIAGECWDSVYQGFIWKLSLVWDLAPPPPHPPLALTGSCRFTGYSAGCPKIYRVPPYLGVQEKPWITCLVPEIIDPVFAKTSPKRSFCMTENERFGLVFVKTWSINSGTGEWTETNIRVYKKKAMDNVSSMSSRVSGNLQGATLYRGVQKETRG